MMIMLLIALTLIVAPLVMALAALAPFLRMTGNAIDCWADSVQGEDPGGA